ncbi:hypothetical protein [Humisphaera borealis]|uniref:Uncharacterized protein n=1 Tax=Humisphaera borealis TaxID=2807512 RepID=A0A7M2WZV7_9BACT|nr:hypothetical protein [Humisphaera borealis]QOV90914.1 hypothetical protein IPV69_06015 [Humisphaera borealis]
MTLRQRIEAANAAVLNAGTRVRQLHHFYGMDELLRHGASEFEAIDELEVLIDELVAMRDVGDNSDVMAAALRICAASLFLSSLGAMRGVIPTESLVHAPLDLSRPQDRSHNEGEG